MENEYRSDIQGLRAVAVLLVFLAHAQVELLMGGFVGVDVFFVISGYVITRSLLGEHKRRKGFDFLAFYLSRMRRLLPALLVMVIVTNIVAFLVFSPYDHSFHSRAGVSALLWMSNIYFLVQGQDYFSLQNGSSLYLHTWSLGIEEQFYLIWPLFLTLAVGISCAARRFLGVLFFTFVLSFVACLLFSKIQPQFAFYQMPTRIWQFVIGGVLAYCHLNEAICARFQRVHILKWFLPMLGLGAIGVSAVLYDDRTPYPGWQVVLPTLGAALLLINRTPYCGGFISQYILSNRYLVWIGDLSYSIYLWHWPVLFFGTYLGCTYWGAGVLLPLLVTLLLASLSYYCIEQPVRSSVRLKGSTIGTGLCSIGSVLFALSLVYFLTFLSESKFEDMISKQVIAKDSSIYSLGCDDWYSSSDVKPCIFGDKKESNKVAVFIGDSILAQWFPAIKDYYVSNGWKLIAITKSSCPMVNRPFVYTRINRVYENCDVWRANAIDYIASINPKLVIFGSFSSYPFSEEEWSEGTRDVLRILAPSSEKVKVILGTPSLEVNPRSCLSGDSGRGSCSNAVLEVPSWRWVEAAANDFVNVDVVDLSDIVCPEGICHAKLDDTIVFKDQMHLTVDFVLSVQKRVMKKILK